MIRLFFFSAQEKCCVGNSFYFQGFCLFSRRRSEERAWLALISSDWFNGWRGIVTFSPGWNMLTLELFSFFFHNGNFGVCGWGGDEEEQRKKKKKTRRRERDRHTHNRVRVPFRKWRNETFFCFSSSSSSSILTRRKNQKIFLGFFYFLLGGE